MSILSAILIDQLLRRSARKTNVRPIFERIALLHRRWDDTRGYKFIESTLHFVMGHNEASIEFRGAAFDLRDECELFDRIVDRRGGGVGRRLAT